MPTKPPAEPSTTGDTRSKRAIVAIGGNAILREGHRGKMSEQFDNARRALAGLIPLIRNGHSFVVVHGNGPQVGSILIRVEEAKNRVYDIPLSVCVAESQGEIGYVIEQSLRNLLAENGIKTEVAVVLTQVLVDEDDPEIKHPVKPVGPFLSERQARNLLRRKIPVVEDARRGYRRVVPSPEPLETVEGALIRKLADEGILVVAGGGGGIAVVRGENGRLRGIDAVIDKDRTAVVIGREVGADELIFLTDVEYVSINFRTPQEKKLEKVTLAEAEILLAEGHFPPGSMGPKIKASCDFIRRGGRRVLITSFNKFKDAYEYRAGTHIIP